MEAKLYVIPGSHACRTGMLLLEQKGIEYETVELPPGLHPMLLRLRGFSGNRATFRSLGGRSSPMLAMADRMGTVPALQLDGQRVKTSRAIARFLEQIQPDPPLFPDDPAERAAVEEAEEWGDEIFQMSARRLALLKAGEGGMTGEEGRLGPLLWRSRTVRQVGTRVFSTFVFRAGPDRSQLAAELPGMLDRIDAWIESGVLDGERLYAADLVIAPSLALLCYAPDLESEIEARPAGRLMDRVLPAAAVAAV